MIVAVNWRNLGLYAVLWIQDLHTSTFIQCLGFNASIALVNCPIDDLCHLDFCIYHNISWFKWQRNIVHWCAAIALDRIGGLAGGCIETREPWAAVTGCEAEVGEHRSCLLPMGATKYPPLGPFFFGGRTVEDLEQEWRPPPAYCLDVPTSKYSPYI